MTAVLDVRAAVPLVDGTGSRALALAPDGTAYVFAVRSDEPEQAPTLRFDHPFAVALARRVLAGSERSVTAPETLHILAAAVLLIDGQCPAAADGELP